MNTTKDTPLATAILDTLMSPTYVTGTDDDTQEAAMTG